MSAWILRYSEQKATAEDPRKVMVLQVTTEGVETLSEVVEVGTEETPELRDLVQGQLRKGRLNLILDLVHVDKIHSKGVGRVVAAWHSAKNSGGELVLAGTKTAVRDIFEITNLDRVILLFDSVTDAAQHFARPADEPPSSPGID